MFSKTNGESFMKFALDVHVPQRMNPTDFTFLKPVMNLFKWKVRSILFESICCLFGPK